ncbi:MAG: alpha/beta hydrolase [Chloroflexi bacterium]|nr:alpha/beta hydrolase [Chloroflexota bacterium]
MAAIVAAILAGVGWYYSNSFEDQALAVHHNSPNYNLRASIAGEGRIRLETTGSGNSHGLWQTPGTFGLEWEGGYGQIGPIIEVSARAATRDFVLLKGTLADGTAARVDTYAFPDDPRTALGIAYEDVTVPGPLGPQPAWFVDGPSNTWAILVHGQGAKRQEMLRPLESIHAAGLKALVIAYRNDEGVASEEDGRYHFGDTEWADLDAAAAYAKAHGATGLMLVGHSMGGGIVMSFLYRSPIASMVRAVILDAPMLNFRETIEFRGRQITSGPVVGYGMWVSGIRFGVDWAVMDYLAPSGTLTAPMLVFHGGDDKKVPLATSEELQRRRPDLVELITWPGVGHVQSWNHDPAAYRAAVAAFLARVGVAH